ncbi:GNAT family N-acetyltransferase [Luedemannella flava]
MVDAHLTEGGLTVWEADGTPVAFAGHRRAIAGTSRLGPVYTPAEHRRRGYGAAVTVAAAQAARAAGATEVVLFTNLANPTSNGVYLRVGFRPVGDRVVIAFR